MKATLKGFSWTDKPALTKQMALLAAVVLAAAFAFAKIHFQQEVNPVVTLASESSRTSQSRLSETEIDRLNGSLSATKPGASSKESGRSGANLEKSLQYAGKSIIERPLFDGLAVVLKGVLLRSLSSHDLSTPVEATITGTQPGTDNLDADVSLALGAKLFGVFSANMDLKRLNLSFNELVTEDGRSYVITGSAFDPSLETSGVEGDYSSGLPARLLGIGIDRAITVADQIAMAKLLNMTTEDTTASKEIQAGIIQANQEATMNLVGEATQGLRSTKAELSLPAGTPITVRIRVSESKGSL